MTPGAYMGQKLRTVARGIGAVWRALTGLTRPQVRSLFAVGLLFGIMALSAQGWVYVGLLYSESAHAVQASVFFGIVAKALRWTFLLIGFMTFFVALVVFGADWLSFKYGDVEIGAGKGQDSNRE